MTLTGPNVRRILRRGPMTEESDLEPETAGVVALILALELARDLTRVEAMRATGVDALRAWRHRRAVINRVVEALIADLAAANYEEIAALNEIYWRVRKEER